jgi:tetraacyldisaccharide 4'-kinase
MAIKIAQEIIQEAWKRKNTFFYLILVPFSWIFGLVTWLRRLAYRYSLVRSYRLSAPVIIVGNINVGGSGKTPVVIWLIEQLKQNGYQPGVISRGYGGGARLPTKVTAESDASLVGDEPVLIANRCDCPVWVGENRVDVGEALLKAHPDCNVVISDDGLQHYRLKRDIEIAVVDADSSNQSARLLPAGPLREPLTRLNTVDAIISNGEKLNLATFQMQLMGERFYNLADASKTAIAADFNRKVVRAMAGIGKPERFYDHMCKLGLTFTTVSFDDHHSYTAAELAEIDCEILIMTEKDAVKCKSFAEVHHWVLPVEAQIDDALMPLILAKLQHKNILNTKE